jgi:hypothetical protein
MVFKLSFLILGKKFRSILLLRLCDGTLNFTPAYPDAAVAAGEAPADAQSG